MKKDQRKDKSIHNAPIMRRLCYNDYMARGFTVTMKLVLIMESEIFVESFDKPYLDKTDE